MMLSLSLILECNSGQYDCVLNAVKRSKITFQKRISILMIYKACFRNWDAVSNNCENKSCQREKDIHCHLKNYQMPSEE